MGGEPTCRDRVMTAESISPGQPPRATRHLRCRVFRRTSPDCGWLPSNQRLGEACGGATDGQTDRYGVFTVSKCESFLLRRLGISTGRWGGNLGFKAREVGKRPKCRVSWGKEKIHRPQALCFSGSQNSASASQRIFRGPPPPHRRPQPRPPSEVSGLRPRTQTPLTRPKPCGTVSFIESFVSIRLHLDPALGPSNEPRST